jgi:putative tricarboxylic transport membrane protein
MEKKALRDGELLAGALFAALGLYIFLQAREWDYYTADGPGPGFFPSWYGLGMTALSLALIVSRLRHQEPGKPIDWPSARRALFTWAAFAFAVMTMGVLGFLVSFALLTFFMVLVVFRRPVATAAATAVVAALGFYLIFPLALSMELPTGLLGF